MAYKIIAILLHIRHIPIQESLDHGPQCAFRPGRGYTDAIFTIKIALKKRPEHGKESWVFFLDLVKAFDRVPRELLLNILARFGVPPKLISPLKVLYANFKVKLTVDEVTQTLECIIGVKKGDILGPILFTFFIATVMITWKVDCDKPACAVKTKMDVILTGRSYQAYGYFHEYKNKINKIKQYGEEYALHDSEYAGDTAVLFDSREHLTEGIYSIMSHFTRFGMEVHSGKIEPREDSKSKILFIPKSSSLYKDSDNYDNTDLSDVEVGKNRWITIVDSFTYLGSVVTSSCTDENNVDTRIKKAGRAFGSIKKNAYLHQLKCR